MQEDKENEDAVMLANELFEAHVELIQADKKLKRAFDVLTELERLVESNPEGWKRFVKETLALSELKDLAGKVDAGPYL